MAGNNLQILGTGIDHCYVDGIPIVEAVIDMKDVYKKVARISSLAVQADPYFEGKSNAQRLFSESHGEGDRITRDFLEEGARDILPIFSPFQRLIPEGTFNSTKKEYEFKSQQGDFSWVNPDPSSIFIDSVQVRCTDGNGDITFEVDGSELGTVTLPDFQIDQINYLAYDLAGNLGGEGAHYFNWTHRENTRDNNLAQIVSLILSNDTGNFTYDVKICTSQNNAIGWIKALTKVGDVAVPSYCDDININYLIRDFYWENKSLIKVKGAVVRINSGSAYVTIKHNGNDGIEKFIKTPSVAIGEDYFGEAEDISTVSVELREASDDFNYSLILNTELPKIIPSPRFEFDSSWNEGKVIFRYQNMDTRSASNKLNYTSETLRDTRVDPNTFDEVKKYLSDSLKNYILKELYQAIGYDKKAMEYSRKYENSRRDTKFWLRSEKGLQTQYVFSGV